jgi:hypothetical protein
MCSQSSLLSGGLSIAMMWCWHACRYVMLRGVNDTMEHAAELVQIIAGIGCKVNLIVFNTHDGSQFQPSLRDTVQKFRCWSHLYSRLSLAAWALNPPFASMQVTFKQLWQQLCDA